MDTYTLIITGLNKKRAKEIAEDFGGGEMMWNRVSGSIFAYPFDDSSIEIVEHKENPSTGQGGGGDEYLSRM